MPLEVLPPEENMKRDEENLTAVEEGTACPPLFRLYEWDRLCISLGRNQEERSYSVPTVRRPTGGGALLHGWDISFSFVDFKERWGVYPKRIYSRFLKLILDVFSSFGLIPQVSGSEGYSPRNHLCLWRPSFGEVHLEGRKLVALAMRTLRKSFLIHGSVYVKFDFGIGASLLRVSEKDLKDRVITLEELGIKKEDFVCALQEKFESLRGGRVRPDGVLA